MVFLHELVSLDGNVGCCCCLDVDLEPSVLANATISGTTFLEEQVRGFYQGKAPSR